MSIFFFFQSNRENGKSIVPFNSRRNTKDYSSQLFLGSQWHVGGYMLSSVIYVKRKKKKRVATAFSLCMVYRWSYLFYTNELHRKSALKHLCTRARGTGLFLSLYLLFLLSSFSSSDSDSGLHLVFTSLQVFINCLLLDKWKKFF